MTDSRLAGRKITEPVATPETAKFWEAAAAGKFIVKACKACGKAHWYPRNFCPFCGSTDTYWKDASGKGKIYTYSVMRRAVPVYAIAYVTLDEGPTMMTNLVDCDYDKLKVGDRVEVTFAKTEGGAALPLFRPVAG